MKLHRGERGSKYILSGVLSAGEHYPFLNSFVATNELHFWFDPSRRNFIFRSEKCIFVEEENFFMLLFIFNRFLFSNYLYQ